MKKDSPIKIGDTTYLLRFNFNAMTTIEDLTTLRFAQVFSSFVQGSMSHMKVVFFAGLKTNHPDIKLDQISSLLDEADDFVSLRASLIEAVNGYFNKAQPETDESKKKSEA